MIAGRWLLYSRISVVYVGFCNGEKEGKDKVLPSEALPDNVSPWPYLVLEIGKLMKCIEVARHVTRLLLG
jgi:hypothetical protein